MLEIIYSFPEKNISGILNRKCPWSPVMFFIVAFYCLGVITLLQSLDWICRVAQPRLHLPVWSFYTCLFKLWDDMGRVYIKRSEVSFP